ncbi:copper homeostasis CutC domain-containing protein [Pseudomassariella vexata]|uniref:Copper homeostasis protein cutC homolog n=1 Tax=Pseudomassariella vexata TaxID=1141098 RepID=A0A1Y2EIA2_9PEZI|nr:copper homeostasis CutC domain-containing protein [Pseudomassariella vexata]ORY71309.1 copper homeostasis CutC domain-containing protein [Pseudomassariella vexata]
MPINLEIPIFGPASAQTAAQAGASRVELNAAGSYPAGGLTPSLDDLSRLSSLTIPVRVMIRPRGPPSDQPDFVYSDAEVDSMELSIQDFKTSGLMNLDRGDGFVFGILRLAAGRGLVIDGERNGRLVEAARPYKVIFHRAFDAVIDYQKTGETRRVEEALRALSECGFDAVLTSAGPGNAIGNVDTLARVVELAANGIEVIVGGGVRSSNVEALSDKLRLRKGGSRVWMHSSCLEDSMKGTIDVGEVENILKILAY